MQSERESIDGVFDPVAAPRCQARPGAFAHAHDHADQLCSAIASRIVQFRVHELPVCRLHEATYASWGDDAEAAAAARWAWGTWSMTALAAIAAAAELVSRAS